MRHDSWHDYEFKPFLSSLSLVMKIVVKRMRYSHLYKQSYELCLYIEGVVDNFSRASKYSIGIDLKDSSRQILKLIVRAKGRRNKRDLLIKLREEIQEMKILLHLSLDIMAFPDFESFERAISLVADIERQHGNWTKGLSQTRDGTGPAAPIGKSNLGIRHKS